MRQLKALVLLVIIPAMSAHVFSQEASRGQAQELLRQASKLVPDVPEPQQMSVASNIASAQARAGDLHGALSTVYLLKKPQAQAQALGSIAHFIDYSGNLDGALKLIESAAKGQNRDVSYADIAWAHAHKGDFATALRVAHLIQNDRSRLIEALNGVAAEQWKSRDHASAERTWAEAVDAAEHRSGDEPVTEFFLLGIAGSRAQAGDTAGALQLLSEIRLSIEQHHPVDQGLLAAVANSLAQAGQLTEALDIIRALPPGSNRDINLMIISDQLMKQEDVADAKETAAQIADPQLRAHALQEIAQVDVDRGRQGSAMETLDVISSPASRAEAMASVALGQADHGDDAATDTLRRAVVVANEAAPKPPDHVFATIAVTEAILGDFETAEATVRLLSSDARPWAWWNITAMMVRAGDLTGALGIATGEKDAHAKAYALLGSANGILDQLRRNTESNNPK